MLTVAPSGPETEGRFRRKSARGFELADDLGCEGNVRGRLVATNLNDGSFVVDLDQLGEDVIEGVCIEHRDSL